MAIANQSFTSGYCASQSWLPTSCSAGRDFVTSQVRPMVKAHFFPASRFKQNVDRPGRVFLDPPADQRLLSVWAQVTGERVILYGSGMR